MKYKRLPIVLVIWRDSVAANGWRSPDDWHKWIASDGEIQETVGFLFERTKRHIAIVQSVQQSKARSMASLLQIPAVAVLSVRRLRAPGEAK